MTKAIPIPRPKAIVELAHDIASGQPGAFDSLRNLIENIAIRMREEETEALIDLRKLFVDFDIKIVADAVDEGFFLVLYVNKKLTKDVWLNLATDASFDFPLDKLNEFVVFFGDAILGMLNNSEAENMRGFRALGKAYKLLYQFFLKVEENPTNMLKGTNYVAI